MKMFECEWMRYADRAPYPLFFSINRNNMTAFNIRISSLEAAWVSLCKLNLPSHNALNFFKRYTTVSSGRVIKYSQLKSK